MGYRFYNNNLPKFCKNCVHGSNPVGTADILCKFRGPVEADDYCRKYKYDPLKREPNRLMPLEKFNADDFVL